MLVSFAVANFRSFAAKQTFSLIASRRLGTAHDDHALPIPDSYDRVLRAGVIYGANGAGKSNLLAALRYMRRIALEPRKDLRTTARNPFRLADLRDQPTTFDLQFIAADKLYRYGLSIDDARIIEERLLHVTGSRQRLIYERRTDSNGKVEIDAPGLRNESDRLEALVTVGSRHNQTFLATVRATLERGDFGKTLAEVIDWLDNGLTLIGPESTPDLSGQRLVTDIRFRHFASHFLKASSTGVAQLKVEKKSLSKEEAESIVPKDLLEKVLGRVSDQDFSVIQIPNGVELLIERAADGERFYRVAIQAAHKNATRQEITLALAEESDGTQRLLELIPALYQAESPKAVHAIDEIDRSLHPLLVYKFLEYFLHRCSRTPCQIIVTTQESHVLDLDLLRRDEIWFAEKDSSGATNLYALTDFNVRKDLHVQKGYLEGRFGAVPFLGEIDRLIETGPKAASGP